MTRPRVSWGTNDAGWCVATVHTGGRAVFVALMRAHARSWKWLGFANGHPLGTFDGLTLAKREAPKLAKEYAR